MSKNFNYTQPFILFICCYFSMLLLLTPISLQALDSYYYWDWSRHLDFSYYDGPPLIAYFIKVATLLFGDNLFALNVVSLVTIALTSWLIYKTARLFLTKEASYCAALLWLLTPLVTLDLLKQTTYDNPQALFWALTLYYVAKFICTENNRSIYAIGIAGGLLLLSKYSGIVLLLAVFIFLLKTRYRYLLKMVHFYAAGLLTLIFFSPVILWNIQHHWQSFSYQLTTHQLQAQGHPLWHALKSFFTVFLSALNFMLLPPLIYWLKQKPPRWFAKLMGIKPLTVGNTSQNLLPDLCLIICTTFILFYLVAAAYMNIRGYWLTPYLITSALLAGFCFQMFHYHKLTFLLLGVYAVISCAILLNGTKYFQFLTSKTMVYYRLMQDLTTRYSMLPNTVFTTGWFEARMLFFLQAKPMIYTLACGSNQNQYALWSAREVAALNSRSLNEILYIDVANRLHCVKPYFDECKALPLPNYRYRNQEYTVYAYNCYISKK